MSVTQIRVRYAETDQMGVAHHANYPVWFELGRSDLMRARGLGYADIEARGYYLMLSGLEVQYRRAARYDELLWLHTGVAEARSRRVVFEYRLTRGDGETGELLATGRTQHVVTDHAYRVVSLPADILGLLTGEI